MEEWREQMIHTYTKIVDKDGGNNNGRKWLELDLD